MPSWTDIAATAPLVAASGYDHDDLMHLSTERGPVISHLATRALTALVAVGDAHRTATRELARARASLDRTAAALEGSGAGGLLAEGSVASYAAAKAEAALAEIASQSAAYLEVCEVLHEALRPAE